MPKINVYLPDDLAEAVKESGVPVSAICQRVLDQSVRRVNAIRAISLDDLEKGARSGMLGQFSEQMHAVVKLAVERARADGAAALGTEHLLHGTVAQGSNLALTVLRAVAIEPEQVARDVEAAMTDTGQGRTDRLTGPAVNALELAVIEAITLGHNYVGVIHLLLGLIAEPVGAGGQLLRNLGADTRSTRGAIAATLAGYVQRDETPTASGTAPVTRGEWQALVARLERLEQHVGLTGGA